MQSRKLGSGRSGGTVAALLSSPYPRCAALCRLAAKAEGGGSEKQQQQQQQQQQAEATQQQQQQEPGGLWAESHWGKYMEEASRAGP